MWNGLSNIWFKASPVFYGEFVRALIIYVDKKRGLHTLKGSARMAGAMRLGELTHRLETSVIEASENGKFGEAMFDALDSAYDQLADMYEQLRNPSAAPAARWRGSDSCSGHRPRRRAARLEGNLVESGGWHIGNPLMGDAP